MNQTKRGEAKTFLPLSESCKSQLLHETNSIAVLNEADVSKEIIIMYDVCLNHTSLLSNFT